MESPLVVQIFSELLDPLVALYSLDSLVLFVYFFLFVSLISFYFCCKLVTYPTVSTSLSTEHCSWVVSILVSYVGGPGLYLGPETGCPELLLSFS